MHFVRAVADLAMAKGGTRSSPDGRGRLASVLRGVPNIVQSVVAFAGMGVVVPSTATLTSAVAVNQGLLVTGSVHFGVVPVQNLCVELRGYSASASASAPASATSTTGPAQFGHSNNGDGVASVTAVAGHSWHGWGEGEPRFLQLQRTDESDGSFAFVTPESGVLLVLAAYVYANNNAEEPPVVRVFPDDHHRHPRGKGSAPDQGRARGSSGGGGSAFGADSGRVEMHIDLSEGGHAPEVLWSAAARETDQSPCAQHEAATAASGSLGAARRGDEDATAAAVGEEAPSARQRDRWALGGDGDGDGGGGGGGKLDQAKAALTGFLHSSRRYLGELGSDLWEAGAAVCALTLRGLEAAGQHVHHSALAASTAASEWFWSIELSNRLAQLSPTTTLSSWLWQRMSSTPLSAWFDEASTGLFKEQSPLDLRAWWPVWWVRVGVIALLLGLLQEVLVFVHKYFSSAAEAEVAVAVADDRRWSGSPHQGQGQGQDQYQHQGSASAYSTLVGTFHGADGRVCRLDFGKMSHPAELEPEMSVRKKRRGVFGVAWGSSGSGRSQLAEEMSGGGGQEETDDFSSMFRALSQPSCSVTASADEGEGGGGATSNVVVVTQQSWP